MLLKNQVEYSEEELILRYARVWFRNLPPSLRVWITLDDLVQDGTLVLMHCRTSYDPSRNTKFASYFIHSLLQYYRQFLRRHQWAKRSCTAPLVFLDDHEETAIDQLRAQNKDFLVVEMRLELESLRSQVSADAQAIIDFVLTIDQGESRLVDIQQATGLSYYRIQNAFKECRQILVA